MKLQDSTRQFRVRATPPNGEVAIPLDYGDRRDLAEHGFSHLGAVSYEARALKVKHPLDPRRTAMVDVRFVVVWP